MHSLLILKKDGDVEMGDGEKDKDVDVIDLRNDEDFSEEESDEAQNDEDANEAEGKKSGEKDDGETHCNHTQSRARPGSHHSHHMSKPPRKRIETKASSTRPTSPEPWRSPRTRHEPRPNYYESGQRGPYKRHR